MENKSLTTEEKLGQKYTEHRIFTELKIYSQFYENLSYSIMDTPNSGIKTIINIDVLTYSSIKGTIDSITEILSKGRINDAYALLRKYFDSTLINVYTNLYLEDNFNLENYIVHQIQNWINGSESIPEYRQISRYIKESQKLKPITDLLKKDDRYKKIRNICNDNTHYNFYHNVLLNDNGIHTPNRVKHLEKFSNHIESLFIQHFAYLFYLNDHYFMSNDYFTALELGLIPEKDAQHFVAPFIQKVFDKVIKTKRPDIAMEIKNNTEIQLK